MVVGGVVILNWLLPLTLIAIPSAVSQNIVKMQDQCKTKDITSFSVWACCSLIYSILSCLTLEVPLFLCLYQIWPFLWAQVFLFFLYSLAC